MKSKTWRWFGLWVLLSMMLSTAGISVAAAPSPAVPAMAEAQDMPPTPPLSLPVGRDHSKDLRLEPVAVSDVTLHTPAPKPGEVLYEVKDAQGPALYIIQLEGEPLASYRGGVRGLQPTSPAATGAVKLDVQSAASKAYLNYLAEQQTQFLTRLEQTLGRSVKVQHTYRYAYNGLALTLTPEEAAKIAQLPGVLRVVRNYTRTIQTDTSPQYLDAVGIWDGSNTGGLPGTMGEGIIVGIIDTGINMDHPSFADVGDDGYNHTNPLGAGTYTGWCNPSHPNYDPSLVCNDKLIGVYSYPSSGGNPEDDNSHGSHTASTTAGNVIFSPTLAAGVEFVRMSGMAPHANIIAYDVCTGSGCQGDSILAAIEDAVADGVDVINYSIGGGPYDPWSDPDSLAYLAARDAGVFVATSAGNEGPGAGTVGSPGNSPWMTTVANGTHDRGFGPNGVVDMAGGTPPADMPGTGVSGEYRARIVYAADYGNALCGLGPQDNPTNPFSPGTWHGEIVVCDRGIYYLVDKAAHVRAAGAGGVIIANTAATGSQTYATDLGMPGTHVTYDNAELLRAWLVDSDVNVYTATLTASPIIHNAAWGDVMNDSSSRGPNVNANVLKPDIMAPGTNILAAYAGDADAFGLMSGTSMASPHVAGAAALIRAVHPDWTPAEVQSALMLTSWTSNLLKEDEATPADPFDVGAGRLDLTGAALAGLVLDETTTHYEDADPAVGGDPTTLNLASLANASCLQQCSWERTFRNTTGEVITWTVSFTGDIALAANPASFTVAADGTQLVEFTADVSGETDGEWLFGTVILTPDDGSPVLHLPVAVVPTSGVLPDLVEVHTRRNAGSQMIEGLQAIEILTLTVESFGLTPADLYDFSLLQDPTNGDPYDDLSQVYYDLFTVPAGAKRFVAEITASEAPDVDLFVLYDVGGGSFAEVCVSSTPSWSEYCNLNDPDAGTYLVIVQNWQGSADQPDAITLAVGIVPGTDAGNMVLEGPDSVPLMEPFDLQLFWDEPAMVAGDRWYGAFSLGSAPGNEGDIGVIPVNLIRHEDDVTKTASTDTAAFSDTVTYTLTVQPNVTPVDLTYWLTDTLPTGLTYVPGSASATAGVVNVTGNMLTWSGTMYAPTPQYLMTTSLDNAACAVPSANSGAYLNLQAFGVSANSAISGDTQWYGAFATGDPFTYWGSAYTGMDFTDDGMAFFDSTPGTTPWINEDIPNPADPNNLLAMFWNDWEIIYDGPTNRGVSLATLDGTTGGAVIEYDDVQPWGDSTQTLDFEVFAWRTADPTLGDPDLVFAYDNIALDTPIPYGTIGIENATGTAGLKYAFDDAALDTLQNGMAICFDWYIPTTDPVLITYQATVNAEATVSPLTNVVTHNTDNPGSLPAETQWDLNLLAADYSDDSVYGVAWHTPPHTVWLGTGVTDEGVPSDDTDDGVRRASGEHWTPAATVHLTVTMGSNVVRATGFLAAWFDWNGDGDFGDLGELGFQDSIVTGDNSLAITIPSVYTTGAPVNARFRLYPTGGTPEPTGGVSDGEVEDYAWQFTPSAITLAALTAGPSVQWGGLALLSVLGLGFVVWWRRRR